MSQRPGSQLLAAAALLLALGAGAVTARAQTPAPIAPTSAEDEGGMIHACYLPGSGLIYRVQEAGQCIAPPHVALSWNAAGGQGPGGIAGVACDLGELLRGFDDTGAPLCEPVPRSLSVVAGANPASGPAPLAVDFHCTSVGGAGAPTFGWDFADGTMSTEPRPTHLYELPGDYVATCVVTDEVGNQGIGAASVHVQLDLIPVASVSATPTQGLSPLVVNFECSVTGGNAPLTYFWDFGDGTTATHSAPSHVYHLAGAYQPSCVVTDTDGDAFIDNTNVTVIENTAVTVDLVLATPTQGTAPLTVQFQCIPSGGNVPLTYEWRFGDGQVSTEQTPVHVFALPGLYAAQCQVWDWDGDTDTGSVTVTVQ